MCLDAEREAGSVVTHVERVEVRAAEPLDTLEGVDGAVIHNEIFHHGSSCPSRT